ncbi:MAG: SDR family NAD(P)-dependent oxidoreductase [Saprospiraceae bacterium]|nr:SDR family NAD(P)-dependent oxidoreductase [Saprospiraceae bacterium]
MNQSKRILITGATGFVGSYLARHLVKNGYSYIVCLRRPTSRWDLVADVKDKVMWEECDVLDAPYLENILRGHKIEQIYHCAAVVSFDPRDREEMYRINVVGTENVVNAALEVGIEKLVYVSSIAAIGRVEHEPWVRETNKWQRSPLNSHYAISKYQAEQEVWRGISEGLTAAMVNPTVVLGAQQWEQGTGRLFKQVWEGLRFYTEGSTGYVDVRDVVVFMVKLMESPIDNQRFILNGENMKYKTMFEKIAAIFNKRPASIRVTPFLAALAWRVEWIKSRLTGRRPLITKETARTSGTTFYFDNKKSLVAFPDFSYSNISVTIEETAHVFLDSKKQGQDFGILNFQ